MMAMMVAITAASVSFGKGRVRPAPKESGQGRIPRLRATTTTAAAAPCLKQLVGLALLFAGKHAKGRVPRHSTYPHHMPVRS
jgi:hypothetical protein